MEPQFIFNADDFGPVDFINEGVYYAVNLGIVNSVQVLVNGDSEESLKAKLLKLKSYIPSGKSVDIGVHFTLTSGSPLYGESVADKLRLWKNMVYESDGKCFFYDHTGFYHDYNNDVNRHEYRRAIQAELEAQRERLHKIITEINAVKPGSEMVFSSTSNHHNIFSVNEHLLETYLGVSEGLSVRSLKALPRFKSNLYYDWILPLISKGDKQTHRKRMDEINDAFQQNRYAGRKDLEMKSPSYIDIQFYRSLGSVSVFNFLRSQKINDRVKKFIRMCENAMQYQTVTDHDPQDARIIEFVFHLGLLKDKNQKWKEISAHYPGIEPGYFEDRTIELGALEKLLSDTMINQVFSQTASWKDCKLVKYSRI